jgi:hypothetical protein
VPPLPLVTPTFDLGFELPPVLPYGNEELLPGLGRFGRTEKIDPDPPERFALSSSARAAFSLRPKAGGEDSLGFLGRDPWPVVPIGGGRGISLMVRGAVPFFEGADLVVAACRYQLNSSS